MSVLLAYLFVDLLTGIYHYITDKGWNIESQVKQFQFHHETNSMDTYDWEPMIAGIPFLVLGLYLQSSFLIAAGSFGMLAQVPHYYAHRRSKSKVVHRIIRFLQKTKIIIPPEHHAKHHSTFDKNFCILSGWNNIWLNYIL